MNKIKTKPNNLSDKTLIGLKPKGKSEQQIIWVKQIFPKRPVFLVLHELKLNYEDPGVSFECAPASKVLGGSGSNLEVTEP